MKSKQENQKKRQLRIKAQMKENLLKRKTLIKLRVQKEPSSKTYLSDIKAKFDG